MPLLESKTSPRAKSEPCRVGTACAGRPCCPAEHQARGQTGCSGCVTLGTALGLSARRHLSLTVGVNRGLPSKSGTGRRVRSPGLGTGQCSGGRLGGHGKQRMGGQERVPWAQSHES